jgi:flagellar biosynthesis protein FlhG
LESGFDYLLIDGGAGIGQSSIQLSCVADTILLIITPEPTSLADAYATAKILLLKGVTDIFVIVNMAQSEAEGNDIFNKLKTLIKNFLNCDIKLLAVLPYDKNISKCVRKQKNINIEKEHSLFASRINRFSRIICGINTARKGNFFKRLLGSHLIKD